MSSMVGWLPSSAWNAIWNAGTFSPSGIEDFYWVQTAAVTWKDLHVYMCVWYLERGLHTAWRSPSKADPAHKHPLVSALTHNPSDSLPLLTLLEPCIALYPPIEWDKEINLWLIPGIIVQMTGLLRFCWVGSDWTSLNCCLLTSLMALLSSSPCPGGLFPVRVMESPKSLITHEPSVFTSTFLLFRSRWDTAGLYTSNNEKKRGKEKRDRRAGGWSGMREERRRENYMRANHNIRITTREH